MKVYIDGKEVEFENEVRIEVQVEPRCGITHDADLEFTFSVEGITAELVEITANSGPSAEVTHSFWETYEEFIYENMIDIG
jgi:hypothetical protein